MDGSVSMASSILESAASDILHFVLIYTSVVILCVTTSSFPSRQQPMCLLVFLSALATCFVPRKGGGAMLLSPRGWVRRIQLSVFVRRGSTQ